MRALNYFLDATVKVGMLCHPKKLTTPAQVVKYCGFLFLYSPDPMLANAFCEMRGSLCKCPAHAPSSSKLEMVQAQPYCSGGWSAGIPD
jgi:hypothetical protein